MRLSTQSAYAAAVAIAVVWKPLVSGMMVVFVSINTHTQTLIACTNKNKGKAKIKNE